MTPYRVEIVTPLQMRYVGDDHYRLTAPFRFRVYCSDDEVRTYEVDDDFVTDLHSFPWFLRILFPRMARKYIAGMNKSAVSHDYFYRFWAVLGITREFADDVYRLMAINEIKGLPEMERILKMNAAIVMHRAVCRFGWMFIGKGDGVPSKRVAKIMKRIEI